ncbi:MAG TPA: PH domain-containing protein, partial [Anaerolineales bacterium]|nr:PH domain-containing protein [Anaerolineales bacterium]
EAQPPSQPTDMDPDDETVEKVLWEGRPYLSLVEKYAVTSDRIKIIYGMVSRDVENYELIRIQDIDMKQNVTERVMGIGDIMIQGADKTQDVLVIRNVKDPETVYEIIRQAWLAARKRYGLQFREYM